MNTMSEKHLHELEIAHDREALSEAVKLLDLFLHEVGPDPQALMSFANRVQRFFRRYDFDDRFPPGVGLHADCEHPSTEQH